MRDPTKCSPRRQLNASHKTSVAYLPLRSLLPTVVGILLRVTKAACLHHLHGTKKRRCRKRSLSSEPFRDEPSFAFVPRCPLTVTRNTSSNLLHQPRCCFGRHDLRPTRCAKKAQKRLIPTLFLRRMNPPFFRRMLPPLDDCAMPSSSPLSRLLLWLPSAAAPKKSSVVALRCVLPQRWRALPLSILGHKSCLRYRKHRGVSLSRPTRPLLNLDWTSNCLLSCRCYQLPSC